jgi:hypothetical protein
MSRRHVETGKKSWLLAAVALCALAALAGCEQESDFDPKDPARGPGGMVKGVTPSALEAFKGGADALPAARQVAPPAEGVTPSCGAECRSYCAGLGLENPVNRGLCAYTWGVGLKTQPIATEEACRRLFVDVLGVFPTHDQVRNTCVGRKWGEVVAGMLADTRFVEWEQRLWADAFRYDTESVSVERIYDIDRLVGKLYRGEVLYDQFAAVASAHPVVTRRYATSGDRAEALFYLFMGRPPLGSERSDIARLYTLWNNGYYDHPQLGMRLPDAEIGYRCIDDAGNPDPNNSGECTSILYGYNELILKPDLRAGSGDDKAMWAGLLKDTEWERLQLPGKLLAQQQTFWENAVDRVLLQYLGYDLGDLVPEVRDEVVRYLLENNGDIRSLHYAVLTSAAYLQSAAGESEHGYRWTWGPLKQVDAEVWLDSMEVLAGYKLGRCDWRLNRPERFLEANTLMSYSLVNSSRWELNEDGEVRGRYRDIARALGGCPSNDISGRFRIISILTTATQLNFVNDVCNPGQAAGQGAAIERLLPQGVTPRKAVDPGLASDIVDYQTRLFYGRSPTAQELDDARRYGEQCQRQVCTAEQFARPACFALLSSAEMLFY